MDANGQMVDFRLTARRDDNAARAFLNKAIGSESCGHMRRPSNKGAK
nr:DDE-type integrase/transposase/recombinase [Litoreibacter roseus]